MRFSAEQDIHDGSAEADESFVRKEIERIRGFVGNLSMGDLRQGTWFVKLLAFSLDGYVQEVDAAYFREKYGRHETKSFLVSRSGRCSKS